MVDIEEDIKMDPELGMIFLEISSDEAASSFRKDVVIPYFKDIFNVSFADIRAWQRVQKLLIQNILTNLHFLR